jgi:(p)ppGpp synthase/HD superfamily hydrolase
VPQHDVAPEAVADLGKVRAELEDLAFKFLEPKDYRALAKKVAAKKAEREKKLLMVLAVAGHFEDPFFT